MNTCENELPVASAALPNEPPSAVTVCSTPESWLAHVTCLPTKIVMARGVKANPAMETAVALVVVGDGVVAGGAGVVGGGVDAARLGVGVGLGLLVAWGEGEAVGNAEERAIGEGDAAGTCVGGGVPIDCGVVSGALDPEAAGLAAASAPVLEAATAVATGAEVTVEPGAPHPATRHPMIATTAMVTTRPLPRITKLTPGADGGRRCRGRRAPRHSR